MLGGLRSVAWMDVLTIIISLGAWIARHLVRTGSAVGIGTLGVEGFSGDDRTQSGDCRSLAGGDESCQPLHSPGIGSLQPAFGHPAANARNHPLESLGAEFFSTSVSGIL